MNENNSMYILSNGSYQYFPDNTLSKFSTKLPFSFELPTTLNEKWCIALNTIGLSSNFKSDISKKTNTAPYIIQIRGTKVDKSSLCEQSENCFTEKITKHKTIREISDFCTINETSTCFENEKYLNKLYEWSIENLLAQNKKHFVYEFYHNDIRHPDQLNELKTLMEDSFLNFEISHDHKISISNKEKYDYDRIFFIRQDFTEKLIINQNLKNLSKNEYENFIFKPHFILKNLDKAREINQTSLLITNKLYFIFVLNMEYKTLDINFQKFIETQSSSPDIIKIKCNNIYTQFFNNSYSRDLEILRPNFSAKHIHFFHEFEVPTFIPLQNTTLNDLTFEITDEHDNQLELDHGIPTLLQISFKRMNTESKSFSLRIAPTLHNHGSVINDFTTVLPSLLTFDNNWRVGLKSITFPNHFKSFPDNHNYLLFHKETGIENESESFIKIYIPNETYDEELFLDTISTRIAFIGTGLNFSFDTDGLLNIKSTVNCTLKLTPNLAKLVGFQNALELNNNEYLILKFIKNQVHIANNKPTWDIFKPAYLMIYCDIIKPTLISSEYTNILKIVPIQDVIEGVECQFMEFKNIEYREISNNFVSEIKIQIRSHSGEFINFDSNFICLHLYFTNNI